MKSLADNHGFVDGNRRIAIAATDTSLRLTASTSLLVKWTFTFHASSDLALIARILYR
jgi:prophage maintenance system killer protein